MGVLKAKTYGITTFSASAPVNRTRATPPFLPPFRSFRGGHNRITRNALFPFREPIVRPEANSGGRFTALDVLRICNGNGPASSETTPLLSRTSCFGFLSCVSCGAGNEKQSAATLSPDAEQSPRPPRAAKQ